MKFSLSFLLVSMIMASLVINMWNNYRIATAHQRSSAELSAAIEADKLDSINAVEKAQVYERSFNAFEKRKIEFDAAIPKFETVANKYSVLEIADPARIHMVASEVIEPENGFHETFRIWLPESPSFHLQFGFHDDDHRFVRKRDLRDSNYFAPAEPFSSPLMQGESRIELIGTRRKGCFEIELLVNETVVHKIKRKLAKVETLGFGKSGLAMADCINVKAETHTILSIRPPGHASDTERVAIKIVKSNASEKP